jgi:FADH2 O2-dependent halogenase
VLGVRRLTERCEVAVVGSGFAGSLIARILAVQGYRVMLLERGEHPRFAIGESSTPLANLSLERIARRYGLEDCYQMAAHGRWITHMPNVRRGLKRGFTFYRHHRGEMFRESGAALERLLVAASPDERVADSHWLRADVDQHFVKRAADAGVDYRDHVELSSAEVSSDGMRLRGERRGSPLDIDAGFVIDASGPNGFLARQLGIPTHLDQVQTRSALVFSHFSGVGLMQDVAPQMPAGPYPDDWAAVHHVLDEGWMYSLRFDDGVTSAGFLLSPRGLASLSPAELATPTHTWKAMIARYPTLGALFASAVPLRPIEYHARIQHRLAKAAGERWVMLPHAFAFVDPLFSTGIAWGLRAVERLSLAFESTKTRGRVPAAPDLERYAALLRVEASQIDALVAGAYDAMSHFDLFTAHAMIYFASVSFAEVRQRIQPDDAVAWQGFLGVGDPSLEPLVHESRRRLAAIGQNGASVVTSEERRAFVEWVRSVIGPRNVAGLADPARGNLYPVDLDAVVNGHDKLGLTRDEVVRRLPALRGVTAS